MHGEHLKLILIHMNTAHNQIKFCNKVIT